MKAVIDKDVLSLADDIRIIARITGKKMPPGELLDDLYCKVGYWERSIGDLCVVYVEEMGIYVMKRDGKVVFFYRHYRGERECAY